MQRGRNEIGLLLFIVLWDFEEKKQSMMVGKSGSSFRLHLIIILSKLLSNPQFPDLKTGTKNSTCLLRLLRGSNKTMHAECLIHTGHLPEAPQHYLLLEYRYESKTLVLLAMRSTSLKKIKIKPHSHPLFKQSWGYIVQSKGFCLQR